MGQILQELKVRACLKNHSRNLHAPLCGIFYPNSVAVARQKKGADFPNTEDLLLLTESRESPVSITNIRLTVYKCDHLFFLILQAHAV